MSEHTKGPWKYDKSRDTHDCIIYQEGADESDHCKKYGYINRDSGGVVGSSEWIWIKEADAQLIAAAPDLLAACEEYLDLFRSSDMRPEFECHELYEKAKQAIAKAEGNNE